MIGCVLSAEDCTGGAVDDWELKQQCKQGRRSYRKEKNTAFWTRLQSRGDEPAKGSCLPLDLDECDPSSLSYVALVAQKLKASCKLLRNLHP